MARAGPPSLFSILPYAGAQPALKVYRSGASKTWTYGGVGIETSSSADHHVVKGQLERKKKQVEIRGLNRNYNHDLEKSFQGSGDRRRDQARSLRGVLCGIVG